MSRTNSRAYRARAVPEIRLTDGSLPASSFNPQDRIQVNGPWIFFNSREQGWSSSPEPWPAGSRIVVQPPAAATVCEVVYARSGRQKYRTQTWIRNEEANMPPLWLLTPNSSCERDPGAEHLSCQHATAYRGRKPCRGLSCARSVPAYPFRRPQLLILLSVLRFDPALLHGHQSSSKFADRKRKWTSQFASS